jgi:hypothetical protein
MMKVRMKRRGGVRGDNPSGGFHHGIRGGIRGKSWREVGIRDGGRSGWSLTITTGKKFGQNHDRLKVITYNNKEEELEET